MHSGLLLIFRRFSLLTIRPFVCAKFHSVVINEVPVGLSVFGDGPNGKPRLRAKQHFPIYTGFTNSNLSTRSFSKEIAVTSTKADQDFLLNNLASASSISDVLRIVEVHHSIMNSKHLIQALRSLFELKKLGSDMKNFEILRHPEFITLCKSIKSQARGFELKDTIQALKIVCYIGVPSTSTVSQVLLQLIRHNVNDLSLQQIVFLDFLLKKMGRCPLVEALKIALPLVFEAQLTVKLDRSNMILLVEMLQYASKKPVSSHCLETLVDSLTTLTKNGAALDHRMAKTIIWALCDNRKPVNANVLLQKSLTAMAESIECYTFEDIEDIVSKLVQRILRKRIEFYHEDLMDSCALYVIKKDCGFTNGIWILRKLSRIAHTNIDLLNYICEKIVLDPSNIQGCKPHVLFTLVTGFSNADYKPANWEIIKNIVLNHPLLEEGQVELPWLKFAIELAALGCYSSSLLERILQEDFLRLFLAREDNTLDYLQLLSLHQALVTLYPVYKGPFAPTHFLEKAIALNGEIFDQFPLEAALVKGLGGPAYLQTKVYTKLGHFIDHVIIMRKGGFPAALSPRPDTKDSRVLIEDMEIPVDSQIVAVLALHPGCYSVNCSRLRGNFCLLIHSLEALNLSVVPISLKVWSNVPEQERIPYLMQEVKIKCNSNEHLSALQ